MAFARFMASFWGRAIRVLAGLGIIWWGMGTGSVMGIVVPIIGGLLVLSGILNVCALAPLFGAPFRGKDIPPKA
ncbi:MAG: YgaP-like transmembrane domain [Minisyncoccota bacterium]